MFLSAEFVVSSEELPPVRSGSQGPKEPKRYLRKPCREMVSRSNETYDGKNLVPTWDSKPETFSHFVTNIPWM